MLLQLIGRSLDMLGKLMVAFTAIMVHHRFLEEHKVDNKVFSTMKREQLIGVIGIGMMIIGFVLEMVGMVFQI